ncbi:MAG: NAD(P)-binding domain-containing protein, partial [Planctomycetes bacterium]|nr:NAD(P)-binding domain-containing protein [Planctomycetota bacterium]
MKIGFIGLGIMGKPMVRNLLKAGHAVTVYDVLPDNVEQMRQEGADAAASSRAVAAACPIVITMLPNSPHVKEAVLGADGVLAG